MLFRSVPGVRYHLSGPRLGWRPLSVQAKRSMPLTGTKQAGQFRLANPLLGAKQACHTCCIKRAHRFRPAIISRARRRRVHRIPRFPSVTIMESAVRIFDRDAHCVASEAQHWLDELNAPQYATLLV
jgi:hypothetical protein